MQKIRIPGALNRGNWRWTDRGVEITIMSRAGRRKVFLPAETVDLIAGTEMQRMGVGAAYGVGAPCFTVAGFFGKLKRGLKKLGRKVVPKAVRKIAKRVGRVAKKVGRVAKKVVTHPAFRAGFAALATAVPVLAPAAAGLEVATRVMQQYEAAEKAAKDIQRGVKTAENLAKAVRGGNIRKGVASMMKLAAEGDPRAKKAMGAIYAAKMVQRHAGPSKPSRPSRGRRRGTARRSTGRTRAAARSAAGRVRRLQRWGGRR